MLNTTKAKKALKKDFQWGGLVKELVDKFGWRLKMIETSIYVTIRKSISNG